MSRSRRSLAGRSWTNTDYLKTIYISPGDVTTLTLDGRFNGNALLMDLINRAKLSTTTKRRQQEASHEAPPLKKTGAENAQTNQPDRSPDNSMETTQGLHHRLPSGTLRRTPHHSGNQVHFRNLSWLTPSRFNPTTHLDNNPPLRGKHSSLSTYEDCLQK